ncbi:MAG TPA: MYXO-CTERM sorting domain-containing protein [Kofleriaceae bacterium]|jgi:uncharacterized protein (TIGR03382 family)|nr:MYXO-CTERM sorting domain-containing protein [Kofleriaceae bacterium]
MTNLLRTVILAVLLVPAIAVATPVNDRRDDTHGDFRKYELDPNGCNAAGAPATLGVTAVLVGLAVRRRRRV